MDQWIFHHKKPSCKITKWTAFSPSSLKQLTLKVGSCDFLVVLFVYFVEADAFENLVNTRGLITYLREGGGELLFVFLFLDFLRYLAHAI